MAVKETVPIGVHTQIERLVVEQLCGPFRGVDLGDLRGDDEARDLEELVGADVLVAENLVGPDGVAQSRVGVWRRRCLLSARFYEGIVLAGEDVVKEA